MVAYRHDYILRRCHLHHRGRRDRRRHAAPELKAPLGIDAREALARLVDNKTVSCDLMDVDTYGRPVVRCGTATTPDIACELVRYGTARDFPRYSAGYYASCAQHKNSVPVCTAPFTGNPQESA